MSEQEYPLHVTIYMGENRLQIIPLIKHISNLRVQTEWYRTVKDINDFTKIGNELFSALEFIQGSPIYNITHKERKEKAAWKKGTKYRSWKSFAKNNFCASFLKNENGEYIVYSTQRNLNDGLGCFNGCIKEFKLPSTATAEELGKAVTDVLKVAEEFYSKEE